MSYLDSTSWNKEIITYLQNYIIRIIFVAFYKNSFIIETNLILFRKHIKIMSQCILIKVKLVLVILIFLINPNYSDQIGTVLK